MMRVLVVDDDQDTRAVVRRVLEREKVEVVEAEDGTTALQLVGRGKFDLVLLDVHLPDMTGLEVLAQLRVTDPLIAVVMLTGAGGESDRVRGLVSGADDYIVKPFSLVELAARVVSHARRSGLRGSKVLEHDGLRVDVGCRTASRDGRPIELTAREHALLVHLMSHPQITFTREQLLHAVWESSSEWQGDATVTEHIRRLRQKIERDALDPVLLVSVRGVGYRFETGQQEANAHPVLRSQDVSGATVVVVGTSVVFVSGPCLALVGAVNASEVVGHDVFEFMAPVSVDALRARHESARRGVWPRPEEFTLRRVDGIEVNVEMASTPVSWAGEPASQVMMWLSEVAPASSTVA